MKRDNLDPKTVARKLRAMVVAAVVCCIGSVWLTVNLARGADTGTVIRNVLGIAGFSAMITFLFILGLVLRAVRLGAPLRERMAREWGIQVAPGRARAEWAVFGLAGTLVAVLAVWSWFLKWSA